MLLSSDKVKDKLKAFTGWEFRDNQLVKTYRFETFMKAVEFINKVAVLAESMDHHPDISIHYNQVTFTASTHSEGGVTEKDFKLIKEIEKLAVLA